MVGVSTPEKKSSTEIRWKIVEPDDEFSKKLIEKYIYYLNEFVNGKGFIPLVMGAYCISLLIIQQGVLTTNNDDDDFVKNFNLYEHNTKYFQNITNLDEHFKSVNASLQSKICPINEVICTLDTNDQQSPFLLAYFFISSLNSRTFELSGNCQDLTLFEMVCQRNLKFFLFCNNEDRISHWQKHLYGHEFNMYQKVYMVDYNQENNSYITQIFKDQANITKIKYNKEERNDRNVIKTGYADNFPPTDNEKPAYSEGYLLFVYLLITLSHVYRHTEKTGKNEDGIAFKEGFMKQLIDYIITTSRNIDLEHDKLNILYQILERECINIPSGGSITRRSSSKSSTKKQTLPKSVQKYSTTKTCSYIKTDRKIEIKNKRTNRTYLYVLYRSDRGKYFYFTKDKYNNKKKHYVRDEKDDVNSGVLTTNRPQPSAAKKEPKKKNEVQIKNKQTKKTGINKAPKKP